jgi:hypothetical protein
MAALFTPRANVAIRTALIGAAVLLVVSSTAIWALTRSPATTGQYRALRQPVPFSHPLHVNGLRIDCRYCHASVERAAPAGLPPTSACVPCHQDIVIGSNLFASIRASLATGRAIPWRRVTSVPDFVFFNHAAHVHAGVACDTCHGPVPLMETVYQAAPLTMEWCVDCHRAANRYGARQLTSCTTCHR